MSNALEKPWTLDIFLAWEERQELRYEFDGVRPIAMTGETFEHDAIQVNLIRALGNRLQGNPAACMATASRSRSWVGFATRMHS